MKINQVEELVGITKKNIRFYEEQGLLNPKRNPENGYRDYHTEDVERLLKIRLFRKPAVPIEDIRTLLNEEITLRQCMEKHLVYLNHEQHNLEILKKICTELTKFSEDLMRLPVADYLEEMDKLERSGVVFMNIEKKDVQKKKIGPIIAALISVIFFVAMICVLVWAFIVDPIPLWIMAIFVLMFVIPIGGVIGALIMRLKEIDGGEEDEASKY